MAISRFTSTADQYYMRQMVEEEVRRREQQMQLEYEMRMQQNALWQIPALGSPTPVAVAATNPDERLLVLLTEE